VRIDEAGQHGAARQIHLFGFVAPVREDIRLFTDGDDPAVLDCHGRGRGLPVIDGNDRPAGQPLEADSAEGRVKIENPLRHCPEG
jgi:hypothetical protein